MRMVPIHELKRHLAGYVQQAGRGARFIITRHRRAVAALESAEREHVFVGSGSGKTRLRPVLRRGSRGKYLTVLEEDRYGDRPV